MVIYNQSFGQVGGANLSVTVRQIVVGCIMNAGMSPRSPFYDQYTVIICITAHRSYMAIFVQCHWCIITIYKLSKARFINQLTPVTN